MEEHDRAMIRDLSATGRKLTLGVLAFASVVLFVKILGHGYSASVDVAHHYALVNWLAQHWSVARDSTSILGEMTVYPRYSHALAAILSRLVGSPFLAMQIVASAAVVVTWAALALSSRLMARGASWFFTAALVVLLALNRRFLGLEVFGHEILGNFFFSQLAAQAAFMVVLVSAAHSEFRR